VTCVDEYNSKKSQSRKSGEAEIVSSAEDGFEVVAGDFAESAANSSRPNAVPAIPQPPSAASVSNTQVRAPCVGSQAIFATISVASATRLF
jgi:hypothetical protein